MAGLLLVVTFSVAACGGASDAELQAARQSGAAEQAQKAEVQRQQEVQASLAAEVERLKNEADARKAAEAAAAKAKADAAAKAAADKAAATRKQQEAAAKQTSCGDNVSVGGSTSCAFAHNVERAFYYAGGGTQKIEVYSPVTGRYYTMDCQAGIPTVCRGGNDAVVYIR